MPVLRTDLVLRKRAVCTEPDKDILGVSLRNVKKQPQLRSAYSPIEWQSNVRILIMAAERTPTNPLPLP